MFREQGAIPPQAVIDATAEYQLKSDKIGNFFSECMEKCPDSNVKLVDVYSTFKNWCTLNRYGVENKGNFIAEIKGKNLLSIRGTVNGKTASNVIKGYRIIGEHNPDCSDKPKYSSVPDSSDEIF
jgi:phage/plasmid-associated DNA primase